MHMKTQNSNASYSPARMVAVKLPYLLCFGIWIHATLGYTISTQRNQHETRVQSDNDYKAIN